MIQSQDFCIRDAVLDDLPSIVAIYNQSIPGRLATADVDPISVDSRKLWFAEHHPRDRPLWVYCDGSETILGWISLNSFYGRPAYQATTEVSIYIASDAQGRGIGSQLLSHMLRHGKQVGIKTVMGFVFGHNAPSLALMKKFTFEQWGFCPNIAELDGIERDLVIFGKRLQ